MWRGAGLFLLCLITFTAGLGRSAIQDSDEAFYAEAGREMAERGDWITPRYNFEPRLQKPILFYWLIAGTYRVAGVSEAAARWWAAISGLGVAFVAYAAGRRWIGRDGGLLAGVIVATSLGVVPLARQSLPDMPLAFFVSVSIWAAIEAVGLPAAAAHDASVRADGSPQAWLYLSSAAAALGTLTKGPVAVALPLTVIAPLLLWERRARRSHGAPFPIRLRHLVVAAVLFVAIAAPWYVAVANAQGGEYWRQFFVGENVERFASAQYNPWRGWFYGPIIVGGLLPWSVFGLLWIRPLVARLHRREGLTTVERRLACWTLGPLVFFMLSIGSQPRYILPCLVPLAILLARTITSRVAAAARDRAFPAAVAATGAAIAVVGVLILRAAPLFRAADPEWSAAGAGAIIVVGLLIVAASIVLPRRFVLTALTAGSAVVVLMVQFSVLVPRRPEPVEIVASAIARHDALPVVCACGAFARSLVFYTHVKTVVTETDDQVLEFLDRPERVMAAVEAATLARVEASLAKRFPRLVEVRYLDSGARQQPGTLLDPDPQAVKRVILISNR